MHLSEDDGGGVPTDCLKVSFDPSHVADVERRVNEAPIMVHCGMRARIDLNGKVVAGLPTIEPYHLGGLEGEVINGGVLLGLVDCTLVGSAMVHFAGARCGTVDISVNMMRPVIGAGFQVTGYVVSKTKLLAFSRSIVTDRRGRICVMGSGVVAKL
jgi:acyl-coenzyme A thioesterase PaaI-like protein